MKKVLSALVLSAAVVATAGQAQAYENFDVQNGFMVGVIYTDSTEIVLNLGSFQTTNNTIVFDHMFSETDKTLATVDYQSILTNRGDTGAVHVSFYLDDQATATATPRYWDAYYATTDANHGGDVPQGVGGVTTGSKSVNPFTKFNNQSNIFLTNANIQAVAEGGADVLVRNSWVTDSGSYTDQMIGQYTVGAGSYGDINKISAAWGELSLDDYADQCEIDMFLFKVRHDTKGTSAIADDANSSLGQIATLRFDQRTGAITLNASGAAETCPVPVPAAAWLLGSGVLGMFGLRRRK
jgi:hypothetical protein